ncbi:MAG: GNAT family N-acetyltransferase [Leptospiraceae bacterium]|nr:GNAT family N-acetyltransferase [Leptospiraceae bacterium]
MIELLNSFFKFINSHPLDGKFKIKPRAATKMVDIFLKLKETGKVLTIGTLDEKGKVSSILFARTEERPYLEEEKILYIEIAYTRENKRNSGNMSALINYIHKWMKKKSISILELRTITDNNTAVEFWKKKGFKDFYIRFRKTI